MNYTTLDDLYANSIAFNFSEVDQFISNAKKTIHLMLNALFKKNIFFEFF